MVKRLYLCIKTCRVNTAYETYLADLHWENQSCPNIAYACIYSVISVYVFEDHMKYVMQICIHSPQLSKNSAFELHNVVANH